VKTQVYAINSNECIYLRLFRKPGDDRVGNNPVTRWVLVVIIYDRVGLTRISVGSCRIIWDCVGAYLKSPKTRRKISQKISLYSLLAI
jgi:hypothetical protein